jgi:hypothetical protein
MLNTISLEELSMVICLHEALVQEAVSEASTELRMLQ